MMDAHTLKALKASIAKWERNALVEDTEDAMMGVKSCPLCVLFHHNECHGCPVFAADNRHFRCGFTPYDDAEEAFAYERLAEFHAAARAEVVFLKSLLPPEEAQ